MTQVVSSLNGVGETERDDLSCNNCAQIFSRKKFLRRHMEACEGSGTAQEGEETSAKQKGYSCSECDSSFRKQKTLNLHLRMDHDINPEDVDKQQEDADGNEEGPETDNGSSNSDSSEENNEDSSNSGDEAAENVPMETAVEDAEEETAGEGLEDLDASVDTLNDAVEAYQQEVSNSVEITPLDLVDVDMGSEGGDQQEAAEESILVEDDGSEEVVDLDAFPDNADERMIRMQKLMMKNEYFKTRKGMVKPYIPSDKAFMFFEDPTIPDGFRVFAQSRPNGKHVDREFLTPDGFFILRSKLACTEYVQMMEELGEDGDEVIEEEEEDENVIEISSPPKRPRLEIEVEPRKTRGSPGRGPASFKAKLKAKLDKAAVDEDHLEVIKALPRGTKIRFSPGAGAGARPVIRTGRGVTITPLGTTGTAPGPALASAAAASSRAQQLRCCNRTFMTEVGLNRHKEREHKSAAKPQPPGPQQAARSAEKHDSSPSVQKVHSKAICKHCSRMFVNETVLQEHMDKSHSVKCKDCDETFISRLAMLEHTRASHIIPCKLCKTVFKTTAKQQEHNDKMHNNKCEKCDIKFDWKKELTVHTAKLHEWKCAVCARVEDSEAGLRAHSEAEHGSCAECEDEFSWPAPGHSCHYTRERLGPRSERVLEQRLYRGYNFFSEDSLASSVFKHLAISASA